MSATRQIYRPVVLRSRLLRPLFSLAIALAVIAVPTWIAAQFIGAQTVQPQARFVGELRADQEPFTVSLPAGIPIDEILVDRGDEVKAGQTIATLDKNAVRAAKERLENETAALVVERRCLLDPDIFDGMDGVSLDALDEMDQLIGIALRSCRLFDAEDAGGMAKLAEDRALLIAKRHRLLRKQREVVVSNELMQEGSKDLGALETALNLELQITETLLEENAQLAKVTELQLASEAAKLDRLRALSLSIAENDDLLSRLDAVLETPRLYAPRDGRVQRVRALQRGRSVPVDTTLVDISPSDGTAYQVRFQTAHNPLAPFDVGQVVTMRPLGVLESLDQNLSGRISHVGTAAPGADVQQLSIHVALSEGSQALLQSETSRISLIGPETASIVEVGLPVQAVGTALRAAFVKNCNLTGVRMCVDQTGAAPNQLGDLH